MSLYSLRERAAASSVSPSGGWIPTLCSYREERMQKEKASVPTQQKTSEVRALSPQSESEGPALASAQRQELTGQEC